MYVDMFFEELRQGYKIYGIKRGGELEVISQRHLPWFALFVKGDVGRAIEEIKRMPRVVDAKPIDLLLRTPLVPLFNVRHVPSIDYTMIKVEVEKKEYVPQVAASLTRSIPGSFAGEYNIVYPIRVSFDLDIKYFHPKCPIIFQPNSELEQLAIEVIEKNRDLRVMAFDIEVHTEHGRFPKPGNPLLSIQYGVMRLDDPDFFTERWVKDNVVIIESKNLKDSHEMVEQFLKDIDRIRPDIIVGYNSIEFDVKYLRPFLKLPKLTFPDPRHFFINNRAYPHVDLMIARDMMGSSLGVRSQRARALEDVVKEVARDVKGLQWLFKSKYMEAEEKLDHTKISLEWRNRTELFYNYVRADVYLTLILARLWMLTFVLLSSLVQVPITELTRLNTGQIAEYNIVHFLEKLGFATPVLERDKEFKKVQNLKEFERYLPEEYRELFKLGKVYVKSYGVVKHVVEGDFAQLYPTLMSNEALDPLGFRSWFVVSSDNPFRATYYSDPLFEGMQNGSPRYRLATRAFPVLLGTNPLGKKGEPKKTSEHMVPQELHYVVSTYGPIAFLLFKMFLMRRITKKLKKRAKEENRPELKAPDQAVKILNNASYGAFSKRRGFINQVMSGYIFWKTLLILYDVINYAEKKLGLRVLYGDSVSRDTEVIVRINGKVKFVKIADLFKRVDYVSPDGKEYYFPEETIEVLSLDRDGRLVWKPIRYVMRHRTNKKMYRIWFTNCWYLDVTGDHSIILYRNKTRVVPGIYQGRLSGENVWDYLIVRRPVDIGTDSSMMVMPRGVQFVDGSGDVVERDIKLWELVGLLLGDGSWGWSEYYLQLSAGKDVDEIVEKVLEPAKKYGIITSYYPKRKGDITILSSKLVKIMSNFKRGDGTKDIPDYVFDLHPKLIAAFLRGLFTADGTVLVKGNSVQIRLSTTVPEIAWKVWKLLLLLGISASVFRQNKPNKYLNKVTGTYNYYVVVKDSQRFAELVGFIVSRKQQRVSERVGYSEWKKTVSKFNIDLVRVQRIEEIDYDDYVYDIEVEDTHVFFANGVLVHNTDSLFIQCNVEEARRLFPDKKTDREKCREWFEKIVLPKLNEYVRSKYGKEFEIESEASFDVCIYPKLKKGSGASKKSYICGNYDENGRLRVEVFKGDFYKALAPEGIREKLAEFYEEIIHRKPKTESGIEKIMKEFLKDVPTHKLFVKKSIDDFKSEKQEKKEEKKYVVKLKRLNKAFHYAALHVAYAWNLPGVEVLKKKTNRNGVTEVEFFVDAEEVLSTGGIQVYFLPGNDPKEFTVFIDERDGKVVVHKVKVLKVEIKSQREDQETYRDVGYVVKEKYIEEELTREEVLDIAVKSMRRYIIDDIAKKLLPALHRYFGGALDDYLNGAGDR